MLGAAELFDGAALAVEVALVLDADLDLLAGFEVHGRRAAG